MTPLSLLHQLTAKPARLMCGIMSGTSMDAIDVALIYVAGSGPQTACTLRAYTETPFGDEMRERLLRAADPSTGTVEEVCLLHAALGHIYADAVRSTVMETGLTLADLDLIGMHGQTLQHLPEPRRIAGHEVRSTLQAGSGPTLAALLGVPVVFDFRAADMALGGEGAPLVPYVDYLLFRSISSDRALVNIGGIANLTVLRRRCTPAEVIAFDCGPGNLPIDCLMRRLYGLPCDLDGAVAREGAVHEGVLLQLLQHEYLRRPHPKSTGREMFGDRFIDDYLLREASLYGLTARDLVATATAFTAACIAQSIAACRTDRRPIEIYLSGGGAANRTLNGMVQKYFSDTPVRPIDALGIPADAKEAVSFAVLANEWLHGNPANLPSVTGAKQPILLGSLSTG